MKRKGASRRSLAINGQMGMPSRKPLRCDGDDMALERAVSAVGLTFYPSHSHGVMRASNQRSRDRQVQEDIQLLLRNFTRRLGMESSTFSSKSSMIETPVCDSDEEVFFGPVTSKELQKASQLKRRTQFYFPSFDWKPSFSSGEQNVAQTEEIGIEGAASVDTQPIKLSLSADSLESQSFLTSSEKPGDSSKGEYWSALSGNSCGSHSSLNEGHLYSKLSADSLDSDKAPSTVKKCPPKFERHVSSPPSQNALSFHLNISADSLEDSSKQLFNDGILVSGLSGLSSSELKSCSSSMVQESLPMHSEEHLQNVTHVGNETNSEPSQVIVTEVLSNSSENESGNATSSLKKSLDYAGDKTYSVDVESYDFHLGPDAREEDSNDCQIIDPESDDSGEPEVIADKDGGFLSILSEAALYHASQLKESEKTSHHEHEESSSTTQSLEDRFKVFGIDAGALEDQQLSNSIMYTTGRESNVFCTEGDSNTFYTGKNGTVGISTRSFGEPMLHTTLSSENDLSSVSSLGVQQLSSFEEQSRNVNMSSGSQVSAKSESNILNQPIQYCALNSTGSSLQDTAELSDQQQEDIQTGTLNDSSKYQRESLHVSGIYPLNSYLCENDSSDEYKETAHDDLQPSFSAEEYLGEAPHDHSQASSYTNEGARESLHNESGASSNIGELNDTLEEYEMMMKYGVDYILGLKGNKKGNCANFEKNLKPDSGVNACKSPMDLKPKQNSSGSSAEYLDAVEASPNQKQLTIVKESKVLSPLQKQITKSTPQKSKDMRCLSGKTSNLKTLSKLPRAASSSATKLLLTPSPQKTRHTTRPMTFSEPKISSRPVTRPVTPSSEAKLNTFKKPIAPAIPVSRLPRTGGIHNTPKSNNKVLEKIQSPVGAYIHNSPSPVLVTNIKAKTSDRAPYEKEAHAKALWRAGEMKSSIPRPAGSQGANCENFNPNVGCGLPAVKYTRAPCIKLDEAPKSTVPRVGERMTKLLDAPSPQVIKHEGRLRVNCGSPQLAAKMQSMAETFDDSLIDIHSVSGDISVCVSQTACRTNTLGHQ
ncbi:Ribosomal RNA large subunit methyltransferase G [Frankliniella fusca]|uniref:Ribosomal RNA large subunit methyltransferase G n=1 Tax=Frankliniella fusca TaxID=407009 RepID=A0AAE1H365_9NEOP|nr:Ribosomal RNA large subunit methyltransferase G [Frankliniella fusca]